MHGFPCLCDGRTGIRCDLSHCDIAGPGAPGDPNSCRICWLRLGGRGATTLPRATPLAPCVHLGEPTGELVVCGSCPLGKTRFKAMACALHGRCVPTAQADGVACCLTCPDYSREVPMSRRRPISWAYGVTTVVARCHDLLPQTLASLKAGGFDNPRLFLDGSRHGGDWEEKFDLEVTARWPAVRTFNNWWLALLELYLREPLADRYALFQDDLVVCRGLREYLERVAYPERGYLNLYAVPENEVLAPRGQTGFHLSNQLGRGALALVFSREAVPVLLQSQHLAMKPQDADRKRCLENVDGAVSDAMRKAGWREYVHYPSLVLHTGTVSTMGHKPYQPTTSFRGEAFDCLELLKESR